MPNPTSSKLPKNQGCLAKSSEKLTNNLVIGSGIAGLTAALTLAEKSQVLLVTKKNLLAGSSRYAQAGLAAVRDLKRDSFTNHLRDTYLAGAKHGNLTAIKFLVQKAPQAIDWLLNLGMKFASKPTHEAAHSHPRIWHTRDSTGNTVEKILAAEARRNPQIEIWTHTDLLDLKVQNNICFGAYLSRKLEIVPVTANQVILATGGLGALFARTTNPNVASGAGLAIAWRADARLKDLEFIQFHPTALISQRQQLTLLSESLRGEGALLRNARGERFLTAYHPAAELAPRDIVARAIFYERQKGPVCLDFTHAKEKFLRQRFPFIFQEVQKIGLNLARDLIPIEPVAHYACGGIKVNLKSETSVRNLFGVGEVACTGVHGANRLASNSLTEAVVFARALDPQNHLLPASTSSTQPQYYFDPKEDRATLKTLRQILTAKVGLIRNPTDLQAAVTSLQKIQPKSYSAKNAVQTARLITKFACQRPKSLGTHFVAKKGLRSRPPPA